jgi:hypothetical protein
MALFEGKTPAERNKMIAAIVLPLVALVFVVRMLFGSSGPTPSGSPTPTPRRTPRPSAGAPGANAQVTAPDADDPFALMEKIVCCPESSGGEDAGRNIFAFYVKPTPTPSVSTPTPTPTPPPAKVLASLAPQSVFAKTAGFTLQLTGDKFGPADRVYLGGQELPTQYRSIQQLTAQVPASAIAVAGPAQVVVRTPDGKLFSNQQTLNVMQPPAPTYTYVGLFKRQRSNTAVLKDGRGELYSVREGDLVEGRFRVTQISEHGVDVVDKDLNIKYTMPFVTASGGNSPMGRIPGSIQPPPPAAEDDEP